MDKRVLIIEDSTYIRTLIRDSLEGHGFQVVGEARTGEAGIDLAMDLHPDVITLDNVLPDMDGIDVLRALSSHAVRARVVMISAVAGQSVIQESLDEGACEYIIKPFGAEELPGMIKRAIKGR